MSAPPVPARKGFFHSVKTVVAGPSGDKKTVIGDFEEKRSEFQRFLEDLSRIETEIRTLTDRYSSYANSSMSVWDGFLKQYGTNAGHKGAILSTNARAQATKFNETTIPAAREHLDTAKTTINTMLKECGEISIAIKARDEALTDMDYYTDKYQSLIDDRDKTLAKGKPVKQSDLEKIERNREKKVSSETDYNDSHTVINSKLDILLGSRYDTLEPVCNQIATAQATFASGLAAMTGQAHYENQRSQSDLHSALQQASISEAVYENPFAPSAPPVQTYSDRDQEQADLNSFINEGPSSTAPQYAQYEAPPSYHSPPAMNPNPHNTYGASQSDEPRDFSRPPPMVPRR